VKVPQYVADAAQHERQPTDSPSDGRTVLTLLTALFSQGTRTQDSDCCTKTSSSTPADVACCTTPQTHRSRGLSVRLVSTIRALQCRGISLTLAVLSTMMVSASPQIESQGDGPELLFITTSETLPDTPACPPVPPPRIRGV
ncbi:MAG: hypothetical protein ACKO2P_16635, partial [Planctomycetota bacterium]